MSRGPTGRRGGTGEVDRQQVADRRPVVLAVGERVGAAEHQEPAAADADEVPQQGELVRREEAGLDVVEDDRVVAVELVGGLREAVPQLDLVERAEPDQDRLVGALGGLGVGVVEAVEQRAGRPVAGGLEVELRLPAGDPEQADELDLLVVVQGAAEELELPVGPAADVEHAVGPASLVDDDEPAVVGERLLARAGSDLAPRGLLLLGGGEDADRVEVTPRLSGRNWKRKLKGFASSRGVASWRSTSLPASSITAATIDSPAKPTAATSARRTTGADSKFVWLIETSRTPTSRATPREGGTTG